MKTGILTFHNCTNYGAVFQTYALWKTVGNLQKEPVEVIDYENRKISSEFQLKAAQNDTSVKGLIRRVLMVPYQKRKCELFRGFLDKHKMTSARRYNSSTLAECETEYENIIFGSDQIWNLSLTGGDFHYYGDFTSKAKKIAYAASTGSYDLKNADEKVERYLRDFTALSSRERRDQQILKERYGFAAEHVLDPTFLLDAEDWRSIKSEMPVPKEYILLYLISPRQKDFRFAKELGKRTGLPVLYVNYSYKFQPGVKNLRAVSPENFLYLLDRARYVVTNSFHGTALSVNLNKDFFCQISSDRAASNTRIEEVLDRLGLSSRCIHDDEQIQPQVVQNWDGVNERIEKEREESIQYLLHAFGKYEK